jgi:hypothetical protein
VLGFTRIERPQAFEFDGAWLCGKGIEVHLIQSEDAAEATPPLDPKSDHLSFLCHDIMLVQRVLHECGVDFVRQTFHENDLRQVCLMLCNIIYLLRGVGVHNCASDRRRLVLQASGKCSLFEP